MSRTRSCPVSTNFAVSIYVVRALGAVQFGAFGLAYVTYGVALNASRGLATDPLMVRFSSTHLPTWRRAVAICTGTALGVGLVVGTVVLAAAAVLNGAAGAAFLALGLTMPGLMLQDSWRFSFFALGRGGQAFLNDTIWALTLLPALVLLKATGHATVFWFVFAWGTTATIGAAAGAWQTRVIPRLAGAWSWVSDHRDLGPRYLVEGISSSGATQLRSYGIGLILGLAALGSVQAASTLGGPMTILFFGMSLVTIPEAARVLRRSPQRLPLFCLIVSGGLAAAGIHLGNCIASGCAKRARGVAAGPDLAINISAGGAVDALRDRPGHWLRRRHRPARAGGLEAKSAHGDSRSDSSGHRIHYGCGFGGSLRDGLGYGSGHMDFCWVRVVAASCGAPGILPARQLRQL